MGNKDINNWIKDRSSDILTNNKTAFCLSPRNLSEAKFESNVLISMMEKISRQHNIESVAWLLLMTCRSKVKKIN